MSQATTAVRAAPRRATQPGAPVRPKRERLVGLDAMRAVAILGMIYMHVSPTGWLTPGAFADKPAVLAWIESVASGRAMSLFVLMAGISVARLQAKLFLKDRAFLPARILSNTTLRRGSLLM